MKFNVTRFTFVYMIIGTSFLLFSPILIERKESFGKYNFSEVSLVFHVSIYFLRTNKYNNITEYYWLLQYFYLKNRYK